MNFKHWYIDCKVCGRRITLEIYSHTHADVVQRRSTEKLRCPTCLQESNYSGDDFLTAELIVKA